MSVKFENVSEVLKCQYLVLHLALRLVLHLVPGVTSGVTPGVTPVLLSHLDHKSKVRVSVLDAHF